MRWARLVELMREIRYTCDILVEKPEETRAIGRPRRRWEYNIKEIECEDLSDSGHGPV
jgi:hypothetical protein